MSKIYRKNYENFSRIILREFMTEDELKDLDKKYNEAKLKREIERAQKNAGIKIK